MRSVGRLAKWLLALMLVVVLGAAIWLWFAPPDMIRVAAGYAAKMVCSNTFIAGRDPDEVLEADVQAPGHPIFKVMSVDVDREAGKVQAGLLGLFGGGLAVFREGFGCAAAPDGDIEAAKAGHPDIANEATAENDGELWPAGERVEPSSNPEIARILYDPQMTGPGMRAVIVVHESRIVGERYGDGFLPETPLLGWSMTKTVNSAIIGTLIRNGKLTVDGQDLFEGWRGGDRGPVTLAHLMAMSSGLEFNEDYGAVTDVTRMLYLEPDMAAFASAKPLSTALGETFSYSSGTAVMLSRIWQNAFEEPAEALIWPHEELFKPLGMDSAVFETDARGTFVGSSYFYATARDWARFGQFLLQEGVWEGERILPEGYVDWMRDPAPASNGEYGRGQVWLHGPMVDTPEGEDPDAGYDLPQDAYWLLGHDGQRIVVVPSLDLVIVRLGLTPDDLGYKPQKLVEAVAKAVE